MTAHSPGALEEFKSLLPSGYFFELVRVTGKNGVIRSTGRMQADLKGAVHARLVWSHKPNYVRLESPLMSFPLEEATLRKQIEHMREEQDRHMQEYWSRLQHELPSDLLQELRLRDLRDLGESLENLLPFPMRLVICTHVRQEIPARELDKGSKRPDTAAFKLWIANHKENPAHAFSRTLKFPFTHQQWLDTLALMQEEMRKKIESE